MASKVTPYKDSQQNKKQQVARMFNNIAWRYDFLNHFLSLGIDRYWRKKAIAQLRSAHPQLILDVATGTGDFALEAMKLHPAKIFGVDISEDMLAIGRQKIKKKKLQDRIELLEADSEQLFFEDNKFDAVTVAFGVRNFENLEKGLAEMLRVLKPAGRLVILEFSQPSSRFIRSFYRFYSNKITPGLGKMISKDPAAYRYLHDSVEVFPYGETFMDLLRKTGYSGVSCKTLTFGVATVYTATK